MQMGNQRARSVGSRARKSKILGLGVKEGCSAKGCVAGVCRVGIQLVSLGHSQGRGWEGRLA